MTGGTTGVHLHGRGRRALLVLVACVAMLVPAAAPIAADTDPPHLWVFSRTDGFRHGLPGRLDSGGCRHSHAA